MGNLPRTTHTTDQQLSAPYQAYVDELVDAIVALAQALIGRASHPADDARLDATDLDGDS